MALEDQPEVGPYQTKRIRPQRNWSQRRGFDPAICQRLHQPRGFSHIPNSGSDMAFLLFPMLISLLSLTLAIFHGYYFQHTIFELALYVSSLYESAASIPIFLKSPFNSPSLLRFSSSLGLHHEP